MPLSGAWDVLGNLVNLTFTGPVKTGTVSGSKIGIRTQSTGQRYYVTTAAGLGSVFTLTRGAIDQADTAFAAVKYDGGGYLKAADDRDIAAFNWFAVDDVPPP